MKYIQDHEWIDLDNDIATIGVTDFAQQQLGGLASNTAGNKAPSAAPNFFGYLLNLDQSH